MSRSIAEKIGVKNAMQTFFANPPEHFSYTIELPDVELKSKLIGEFDYIHCFIRTQQEFHETFEKLKQHLKPTGMLWVSWPKSGQLDTDLNIKKVIEIGYTYGLVESKAISIDTVWSALKFTFPKQGKTYNNSYGKLT